jgi:hypothetical protein
MSLRESCDSRFKNTTQMVRFNRRYAQKTITIIKCTKPPHWSVRVITKYALNDALNCKEPDPWYYKLADSILREK